MKTITDVIFVIHGIRDLGHWTKKIARRVLVAADQYNSSLSASDSKLEFAIETSTYGYFPMLSFLTPGARQGKVQWLMDKYTEAKSLYPNAAFHYVGHSHGTYLLAKALEDYESVKFENVVFAGSVVRHKYEWETHIPNRINAVQNFVATGDWVVAFFPKALEMLGFQDLGSAGHDGFQVAEELQDLHEPDDYVTGGHGAALQEDMWNGIAKFILTGKPVESDSGILFSENQNYLVKAFGFFPLVVWLVIAAILFFGFYKILKLKIGEWQKTLIIVGYLFFIWTVITRV